LAEELRVVVVEFRFTVSVRGDEVLGVLLLSPPYEASMTSFPAGSEEVLNVKLPALSDPLPRVVEPYVIVTVPVGVPTPVTVVVSVTGCPNTDGFSDEVSVVELNATRASRHSSPRLTVRRSAS
jgi:hypothetical protein